MNASLNYARFSDRQHCSKWLEEEDDEVTKESKSDVIWEREVKIIIIKMFIHPKPQKLVFTYRNSRHIKDTMKENDVFQ